MTPKFKGDFLSPQETIDHLINNKKSLIRWGDGETRYIKGSNLYFQKHKPRLAGYLTSILDDYKNGSTPYLLALPTVFLQMEEKKLRRLGISGIWKQSRELFSQYCDGNRQYGDAFVFRPDPYVDVNNPTNETISQLWLSAKHIVFIHSNEQFFYDFQKKYGMDTYFIQIPKTDAFERYDEIYNKTLNIVNNLGAMKEDIRILISGGPMAKALAYQLSNDHYICYDMGHYFDTLFYGRGTEGIAREWKSFQKRKKQLLKKRTKGSITRQKKNKRMKTRKGIRKRKK